MTREQMLRAIERAREEGISERIILEEMANHFEFSDMDIESEEGKKYSNLREMTEDFEDDQIIDYLSQFEPLDSIIDPNAGLPAQAGIGIARGAARGIGPGTTSLPATLGKMLGFDLPAAFYDTLASGGPMMFPGTQEFLKTGTPTGRFFSEQAEDIRERGAQFEEQYGLPAHIESFNTAITNPLDINTYIGGEVENPPSEFIYENLEDIPKSQRPFAVGGEFAATGAPFSAGLLGAAKMLPGLAKSRTAVGAPAAARRTLETAGESPGVFSLPGKYTGEISTATVDRSGPLSEMMEFARTHPKQFAAVEAGMLGGGALFGGTAEAIDPGNVPLRIGMEVLGSFLSPLSMATRFGSGAIQEADDYIRGSANIERAREIAAQRMRQRFIDQGKDPAEAAAIVAEQQRRLAEMGIEGKFDIGMLSGGDKTIEGLVRSVAEREAKFGRNREESVTSNLVQMRNNIESLRKLGDPDSLAVAAREEDLFFQTVIDEALNEAREAISNDLLKLFGSRGTEALPQIQRTAHGVLTYVNRHLDNWVNEFWKKVPNDLRTSAAPILQRISRMRERNQILPSDEVPEGAKGYVDFLNKQSGEQLDALLKDLPDDVRSITELPQVTTGQLKLFRTRMRELADEYTASDAPGSNVKAFIARELDNAALEALSNTENLSKQFVNAYGTARKFTHAFHEQFSNPFISKALAEDRRGQFTKIAPSNFLELALKNPLATPVETLTALRKAVSADPRMRGVNLPKYKTELVPEMGTGPEGSFVSYQTRPVRDTGTDPIFERQLPGGRSISFYPGARPIELLDQQIKDFFKIMARKTLVRDEDGFYKLDRNALEDFQKEHAQVFRDLGDNPAVITGRWGDLKKQIAKDLGEPPTSGILKDLNEMFDQAIQLSKNLAQNEKFWTSERKSRESMTFLQQLLKGTPPTRVIRNILNSGDPEAGFEDLARLFSSNSKNYRTAEEADDAIAAAANGFRSSVIDYALNEAGSGLGNSLKDLRTYFNRLERILEKPWRNSEKPLLSILEDIEIRNLRDVSAGYTKRTKLMPSAQRARIQRSIEQGQLLAKRLAQGEPFAKAKSGLSYLADFAVRVGGASLAKTLAGRVGLTSTLQAPAAGAQLGLRFMEGLPFGKLMDAYIEIINDPKLFVKLMSKPHSPRHAKIMDRQIHSNLIAAGILGGKENAEDTET